jgi:trk system potassium uptake protein TrkH
VNKPTRDAGARVVLRDLDAPSKVALGYLAYMLLGWFALLLPFSHAPGTGATALDHLFTAASAVSTTGLVTVATGDSYSFFGEIVVLVLIQLGGLGYMTLGSFVLLMRRREFDAGREAISRVTFVLPEGMSVRGVIRTVVIFGLAVEAAGAAALYPIFRAAGDPQPLWSSVFHSVSAFCTAGFSLYSASLEAYSHDFWLNAVIIVLSVLGAIGFIVIHDTWGRLVGRQRASTLTTRIILSSTLLILAVGSLLTLVTEPSLRTLPADERIVAAVFQTMTASTTVGFNTVPVAELSSSTVVLMMVLMLIGASPAGTGGGLKTTTVTALYAVTRSNFTADDRVTFAGAEVPRHRIRAAVAAATVYFSALVAGVFLILAVDDLDPEAVWFEAASALGTVGLSRGITAELSHLSALVVIALMFIGRVGPVTLALAVATTLRRKPPIDSDVAV